MECVLYWAICFPFIFGSFYVCLPGFRFRTSDAPGEAESDVAAFCGPFAYGGLIGVGATAAGDFHCLEERGTGSSFNNAKKVPHGKLSPR